VSLDAAEQVERQLPGLVDQEHVEGQLVVRSGAEMVEEAVAFPGCSELVGGGQDDPGAGWDGAGRVRDGDIGKHVLGHVGQPVRGDEQAHPVAAELLAQGAGQREHLLVREGGDRDPGAGGVVEGLLDHLDQRVGLAGARRRSEEHFVVVGHTAQGVGQRLDRVARGGDVLRGRVGVVAGVAELGVGGGELDGHPSVSPGRRG
jgi:hypothetical protein